MYRPLPLSVRFFALAFVPTAVALIAAFSWFKAGIENNVREGLTQSLAEAQQVQTNLRLEARRQREGLLAGLVESATLKAGLVLWREARDLTARYTVQGQLLELAVPLDADLVGLRDATGATVVTVARGEAEVWAALPSVPDDLPADRRLATIGGRLYELLAVPVNNEDENLGVLVVGKRFDPAAFHREAVLLHRGRVAAKAGIKPADAAVASLLAGCRPGRPCSVALDGAPYLALSVDARLLDPDYSVWTLHSVEQASTRLLGAAKASLQLVMIAMLAAALIASLSGASAVVRPLTAFISKLRASERSGVLEGDFPENSSTHEVNELARAFNLAARSVAESQRRLDEAYLQITQTMAQTLDARDHYTAGHSSRVSDYAVAIARALNLSAAETDVIRIGATLHDIGKIGIPDAVLQKPGPLTAAEFEVIKSHPVIGKQILEGVARFRDYLSIVELHHENQDGSGYPWGLRGEHVPLGARIVHVVDAYDAMTTTRPYRHAMPAERAQEVLQRHAGTQFDPAVVEVFLRLVRAGELELPPPVDLGGQLASLEGQLASEPQRHDIAIH